MDRNETLADIVADIRKATADSVASKVAARIERGDNSGSAMMEAIQCLRDDDMFLNEIADRIEAAAKRETVTNRNGLPVAFSETQSAVHNEPCVCQPAHNAAKLREALQMFVDSVEWLCNGDESGRIKRQFAVLLSDAHAALAAPPRNCDVGSPDEQAKRFFAFCYKHQAPFGCPENCPFHEAPDVNHFRSGWGQLPYDSTKQGGDHADA